MYRMDMSTISVATYRTWFTSSDDPLLARRQRQYGTQFNGAGDKYTYVRTIPIASPSRQHTILLQYGPCCYSVLHMEHSPVIEPYRVMHLLYLCRQPTSMPREHSAPFGNPVILNRAKRACSRQLWCVAASDAANPNCGLNCAPPATYRKVFRVVCNDIHPPGRPSD